MPNHSSRLWRSPKVTSTSDTFAILLEDYLNTKEERLRRKLSGRSYAETSGRLLALCDLLGSAAGGYRYRPPTTMPTDHTAHLERRSPYPGHLAYGQTVEEYKEAIVAFELSLTCGPDEW